MESQMAGGPSGGQRWLAMAVSAALIGVTVIGVFGGTALLRITSGHGAVSDVAIPTPLPLPIVDPGTGPAAGASAVIGTHHGTASVGVATGTRCRCPAGRR